MRKYFLFVVTFLTVFLIFPKGTLAATGYTFPLQVSSDGRYLVDATGKPFRIQGDSPWDFPTKATLSQVDQYLDDRVSRGFNTIILEAPEPVDYNTNPVTLISPIPASGVGRPFLKDINGNTWDGTFNTANFSTPNDEYFKWLAQVIDEAASRGVFVLLSAAYMGYNNNGTWTDGWWLSVNQSVNTQTVMYNYGKYLAIGHGDFGGLASKKNLAFDAGVDMDPTPYAEGEARFHNVYDGLRANGAAAFIYGHWKRDNPALSTGVAGFADLMTLQAVYTGGSGSNYHPAPAILSGYSHAPAMPDFGVELMYENENGRSRTQVRDEQWTAYLSGIAGVMFGNDAIWIVNGSWQSNLNSPGTQDMQKLGNLLDSEPWYHLVPSGLTNGSFTQKTLITSGGSSPTADDYVAAAAANTGDLLIAHIPDPHSGSITVDMSAMTTTARARWYDPTSGAFQNIGTFSNTGTQTFSTPGTNSAGANDWVLVLDKVPSCTPSWSCTAWSTCANSQQTRTCSDANNCGTTTNEPVLSQSCTSAPVCGDGSCNGTETCSSCSSDCGNCNPIAWWKLDETSGSIASDSSGNGFNGTIQGTPTWTSGKISNALSFDGATNYVSLPVSALPKTSGTISYWTKTTSAASGVGLYGGPTAENGFGSSGANPSIGLDINAAGAANGYVERDTSNYSSLTTTKTVNNGVWHLLTMTWQGASSHKIYIDGVLDSTANATISFNPNPNLQVVNIGKPGTNERYFSGLLDDVRVYNRALSASEVQTLYNSPDTTPPAAPSGVRVS